MALKVVGGGKAFKWEGIPEMRNLFSAFARKLGPDGMGEARDDLKAILLKPALVIRDEARDLAPVRTGRLRESIYASKGATNRPGVIVAVNQKKAPYARYIERGTSKMSAHPYFRPAVVATRPLVANMISGDMKKLIEGIANQLAYHPPESS